MKNTSAGKWRFLLAILVLSLPSVASAQLAFSRIVVFGTSLSDPGNAFALLVHPIAGLSLASPVTQETPPYASLQDEVPPLVPSAPYAKGGHHYSNGATWIEQFAQGRGLAADVGPRFQSAGSKARNYAVGGARATDHQGRVNLPQQVQAFLNDAGQTAPADALYVIEIGNNDLGDALAEYLTVFQTTQDQGQAAAAANTVITNALNGIASNIQALYDAGARKFLVWNGARWDLTPVVRLFGPGATTVAGELTNGFNQGLAQNVLVPLSGLPGIQIAKFDMAVQMSAVIQSPSNFGLTNVIDPCVTPNAAPFTCQLPDTYFFWDNIHPTRTVHAIIAQRVAELLANYPNP